jgi:putative peptidoglycan lipid II flippase
VFYLFFAKPITAFFVPNFSVAELEYTTKLVRIMSPSLTVLMVISLQGALLRSKEKFLVSEAVGFPLNLSLILYMIMLSNAFGVIGLCITSVFAILLQFIFQHNFVKKLKFRILPNLDFSNPGFKQLGILIFPVLLGLSINQINFVVERILASGLIEGAITALTLANRLNAFVLGLFSVVLGSIYFKTVSTYFAEGNMEGYKQLVRNTIRVIVVFITPATVGFMLLSLPITRFVFERGSFDLAASVMTSGALFWFSFGLIGYTLREVLTRAFYAMHDTRTAMINAGIAVIVNIVLSILLVPKMAIEGLALSMSVSGLLSSVLLIVALRRKIGAIGLRSVMVNSLKVLFISGVMGIVVWWSNHSLIQWGLTYRVSLLLSVGLGVVVYLMGMYFMKLDEFRLVQKGYMKMRNMLLK